MKMVRETATTRFLIIAIVASMAMIPLIFHGCGPEWARWDAAQANMFFRLDQVEDALYQLRDAVKKSPRDPVLKLTLAERLIESKKPGDALELVNEVLKVYPENGEAIRIKSLSLQSEGKFEDALEIQLEHDKKLQAFERGVSSLNQLAYFRALAKRDLHLAKRDIETAIATQNRYTEWSGSGGLTYPIKATVLGTLVARCCDMEQKALATISDQVVVLRKQIADAEDELTRYMYEKTKSSFPIRQNAEMSHRRRELRFYEKHAAVLLSCRALLHQDLGDSINCQADRLEVSRLGFDCSKIVAQFPDEKSALLNLGSAGALLDTRGYTSGILAWTSDEKLLELDAKQRNFISSYSDSILDLDVAIFCIETDRASFKSPLRNAIEFMNDKIESQKFLVRQEATLLYHRQLIHQRAGNVELAKADEKKIRELGIEPSTNLF